MYFGFVLRSKSLLRRGTCSLLGAERNWTFIFSLLQHIELNREGESKNNHLVCEIVSLSPLKPTLYWSITASPRRTGIAVGGQHQHSEGSSLAAGLVFLPAHGLYVFIVCLTGYIWRVYHHNTSYNKSGLFLLSRQRAWPTTYSWPQKWTFPESSVSQIVLWMTSVHLYVPWVRTLPVDIIR